MSLSPAHELHDFDLCARREHAFIPEWPFQNPPVHFNRYASRIQPESLDQAQDALPFRDDAKLSIHANSDRHVG
jgi:hypothetical protein